MVKGILLDVDGTLVLSNDAHTRAWVDAFATYGMNIAFTDVRPLVGMGGDQLIPTLFPGLENRLAEKLKDKRKELFKDKYIHTVQAAPGARDLIKKLLAEGLRLVIASSADEEELLPLLKIAGVDTLVKKKTSASDVEASKPEPDIVLAALKEISLPATEVLMLGDTPYDIQAANLSKVRTIAFRCGGFPDKSLEGSVAIYDDPQDLLDHYDTSPIR